MRELSWNRKEKQTTKKKMDPYNMQNLQRTWKDNYTNNTVIRCPDCGKTYTTFMKLHQHREWARQRKDKAHIKT